MPQSSFALDPKVLDRLSGLSLVARTVVEGFMSGHHRSPFRGSSSEFSQHREYVYGDELRHIDWQVFGRSDRLVIKEFVEETNLVCHVLVDASESMAFRSLDWSKFDYARWCAAALSHLVLSQRDTAGLSIFDTEERTHLPPGNGEVQERSVYEVLEAAVPEGPTGVGEVLKWIGGRLNQRGIVAVFSDFIDDPDSILEGLKRVAHAGHEPILFQVLDPMELDFDITHLVRLDGLETSGVLKIDPKAVRSAYIEEIEKHIEELARKARALSIDHVLLRTDSSVDVALSTYLARRMARVRGGRR